MTWDTDPRPTWFSVPFEVPEAAWAKRDELDRAIHRIEHIGVSTGRRRTEQTTLTVTIIGLRDFASEDAAVAHALGLLTKGLDAVGLGLLAQDVEQGEVRSQLESPGRTRHVTDLPDLPFRPVRLPDGLELQVADAGPLDRWFAFPTGDPERALAGRDLRSVIDGFMARAPGTSWPQALYDTCRTLAARETPEGPRYACLCCDHFTLTEMPPGTFASCVVCGWEDDGVQGEDLDYAGGANRECLREARATFLQTGAAHDRVSHFLRPPENWELPAE